MKKLILLLLISCCVTGCGVKKDMFSEIHIQANTSTPFGKLSFTDSSLFALAGDFSSQLMVSQNSVLTVILDDSMTLVNRAKFNSVFQIPEQVITIPEFVNLPSGVVREGTELSYTLKMPSDERVDSVVFGRVTVFVNMGGGADMSSLKVTFPQIIDLRTKTALTVPVGQIVDLSTPHALVPLEGNIIKMRFWGNIPQNASIGGTATIDFDDLQYAKGYFSRKVIPSPSITISTTPEFIEFADMIDYLYFANPQIAFDIVNQYNAPMLLTIDTLEISGQRINLATNRNQFFVDAQSKTVFTISNKDTQTGKQLSSLIDKNFRSFKVDVNTIMNPTKAEVGVLSQSYIEPVTNSFSINDLVSGSYSMHIPLDGVLENVRFEQQLDIDLSSLNSDNSQVRDFAFAFSGVNYMPLDVQINAFVRKGDAPTGTKIELFEEPVVINASIDNQLNSTPWVIDSTNRKIVEIKPDVLDIMMASKKIFLELNTSTKNAAERENIKIFSPSSLDLKLQVGAKVDLILGQPKK